MSRERPPRMRGRPALVRDEFFKTENLIAVAWFFYGDGFTGYVQMVVKGVKKDVYYPIIGIAQHERNYDGLYWVAWLWYSFPHRHGAKHYRVLKTGKTAITILEALHPYLRSPKKEEVGYIIEHGSPVTPNIKEKFRRMFPTSKGRKVVVKSPEEIWLEEVMGTSAL
ncbi:MAG: hypothetical protein ACUVTD_01400 [Nitrososphaerales archaeon]